MRAFVFSLALLSTAGMAKASEVGQAAICKVAIGAIMGRDPQTVAVDREAEGVSFLSYVRDDGTKWNYRCKIESASVVWASIDGPWRTRPGDEKVLFEVSGDPPLITIRQVFEDGSELQEIHQAIGL